MNPTRFSCAPALKPTQCPAVQGTGVPRQQGLLPPKPKKPRTWAYTLNTSSLPLLPPVLITAGFEDTHPKARINSHCWRIPMPVASNPARPEDMAPMVQTPSTVTISIRHRCNQHSALNYLSLKVIYWTTSHTLQSHNTTSINT